MRVFISSYKCFSLAIPIKYVSSVMLNTENYETKFFYNQENRSTYVSLPVLFKCPQEIVRHGIIIKNTGTQDGETENKYVLLGTEIENESDIPFDKIYPVPRTLGLLQFSLIFSGISFNKISGGLILLLNPEHLIQNIQKELL